MYTILSAVYANENHTAAIVMTKGAGAVSISERDRPELWAELKNVAVAEFVPELRPVARRTNPLVTATAQTHSEHECLVAQLPLVGLNRAIATDCRKPNEEAGAGTGMLVFRVGENWFTSAGTPAAA